MENFELGPWKTFAESRPAVRCSPGHLIYLQDTEATCFYYLKKGRVKSFIQSGGGAERVLNLYQAGSLFGEASFFDRLPRVSSAVALTPCELVPIDRELVTQAVARDPELAMAMLQYLARTVRLLSEQLDDMAFRPAQWRLARFLLSRADEDRRLHLRQPGDGEPAAQQPGPRRGAGTGVPADPPAAPGGAPDAVRGGGRERLSRENGPGPHEQPQIIRTVQKSPW